MDKRKLIFFASLTFLTLLLIAPASHATFGGYEIAYDDGTMDSYQTPSMNDTVMVRFTPTVSTFKLGGMEIYLNETNIAPVRVWVWDSTQTSFLLNPYIEDFTFLSGPWYFVSFPDGVIFTPNNVSSFYIAVQWLTTGAPNIGIDTTSIVGRSYYNGTGTFQAVAFNYIIQAKIDDIAAPQFDHVPMKFAIEGESITINMEVTDEFGVQSVLLYWRENGSAGSYSPLSLTSSGDPKNAFWYGSIPGINVTPSGIEYYLWATDFQCNTRYYGNATVPFVIQVVSRPLQIPLLVSVTAIVAIAAAAVVLYIILPEYKGVDAK
jgi:hypothetical protein